MSDPVDPSVARADLAADSDDHIHPTRRAALWVARAISYVVYAYLVFVEIILGLGFFLLLFGANPSSSFVEWVYRSLDRVMEPFRGIFTPIELGMTGNDVPSIFETSVLFAMIIYGIVAIAISALIGWLSGRLAALDRADREHRRHMDAMRIQAARPAPTAPPPPTMPSSEDAPRPAP